MKDKKKTGLLGSMMDWWSLSGNHDDITFQSSGVLTLGVEVELQLIDQKTLNLASRAEELLKTANIRKLKPEFYQSTVEINTDKCNSVQEIERDLSESINALIPVGNKMGIQFSTTACHPFSRYSD